MTRRTRRSTKVPTTPASTGSEDEADGTEQVVKATVHDPAPPPDVQFTSTGVEALDDVLVPVEPPEGLQADQDAVIEELAGADSEVENDNMNNTAPRGTETGEEEIFPVAPAVGSPMRERMEISPPRSPEELDHEIGIDDRDRNGRPATATNAAASSNRNRSTLGSVVGPLARPTPTQPTRVSGLCLLAPTTGLGTRYPLRVQVDPRQSGSMPREGYWTPTTTEHMVPSLGSALGCKCTLGPSRGVQHPDCSPEP